MSDSMFLGVAILVFVMLALGLGLTILEFRYGQPKYEAKIDVDHDEVRSHTGVQSPENQRAG
jgi:hypothetical protein